MRFRDKLAQLGAPVHRAAAADAPVLTPAAPDSARSARISQLQALVDRVMARDADRAECEPPSAPAASVDSVEAHRLSRFAQLREQLEEPRRRETAAEPPSHAGEPSGFTRRLGFVTALRRHESLRDRAGAPIERAPADDEVGRKPPWTVEQTERGPVHLVDRWLDPEHRHGRVRVASALERLPATLGALALDPELAGLDLSGMLFLDTETTGLAGGAGTVAFLVGLAGFEDGMLRLTQLVVPNLGAEGPMLRTLAARIAAASCILTYNGKTFDWPLLRTRFVLNRIAIPKLPPHVDLLHATRRIWKPRLGSVRLTEIEREILHHFREDDVDGAEIPARYFAYLRDGGSERLVPVIEHNQQDVIALAAMLGTLGERFEQADRIEQPLDTLAFGKLAMRLRNGERAQAFARAAREVCEGGQHAPRAHSFSGEVEHRYGDAALAARHYEQALLLSQDAAQRAALHLLLTKLYERALDDLPRAYQHARFTEPAEGAEIHGRRLGRLTRKLARSAELALKKGTAKKRAARSNSNLSTCESESTASETRRQKNAKRTI